MKYNIYFLSKDYFRNDYINEPFKFPITLCSTNTAN